METAVKADGYLKYQSDPVGWCFDILGEKFPPDVTYKSIARHGSVYKEILEVADSIGADLIVLTSHRPARSDYLLGPNAARVVRHAKQSVFVVRA